MKTNNRTTSQLRNSIHPSRQRRVLLLVSLLLTCFALPQRTQAVVPAPDGGYGPPQGYGAGNTAEGQYALLGLTSGVYNTATGFASLFSNTTGPYNTAIGAGALLSNTIGDQNTATGTVALISNTIGRFNTANGVSALGYNTTGSSNTAMGVGALYNNTTGGDNTAIGWGTLSTNTSGSGNIALGINAGVFVTTGFVNIDIGNPGVTGDTTTIRIGEFQTQTFIAGIVGAPNFADTVKINPATGQLGDQPSSARFKKDIDPMDKTSEAIFSLRPVTFHYKNDKTNAPQFGLIAEEVAKVNPALIGIDKEGKPYCVQYDAVNAMLLNEFVKEHRKVQELEANAVKQQKQIKALTAGLQKVSAQLEASKPAPQVVNNR